MTAENKKEFSPSTCVYTSCYCEENVWKLCERIRDEGTTDINEYNVVFISNHGRHVPLWMQKSAKDTLAPVVWDYHVILIWKTSDGRVLVYDLDSILPFPCVFDQFIERAIQSDKQLKKQFHRKFRVIPARTFLQRFASDRSHMKKPNGEWIKDPPAYPPIRTTECVMNLDDFIDMTPLTGEGEVMDYKSFVKQFSGT